MSLLRACKHVSFAFKDWISRPIIPLYFFVSGIVLLCDYFHGEKMDKLALTYLVVASLPFFSSLATSVRKNSKQASTLLKNTTSEGPQNGL